MQSSVVSSRAWQDFLEMPIPGEILFRATDDRSADVALKSARTRLPFGHYRAGLRGHRRRRAGIGIEATVAMTICPLTEYSMP
jgi:hypothetical protein